VTNHEIESMISNDQASMTLEDDIFDRFADACEYAQAPNQALRDALVFTKEGGSEVDTD